MTNLQIAADGGVELNCHDCELTGPLFQRDRMEDAWGAERRHNERHHGADASPDTGLVMWSGIVDNVDYDVDFIDDNGEAPGMVVAVWRISGGKAIPEGEFQLTEPRPGEKGAPVRVTDEEIVAGIRGSMVPMSEATLHLYRPSGSEWPE